MRVRRCAVLMIEPRERIQFDLVSISKGRAGLASTTAWFALAPHIGTDVELTGSEVAILGALSPTQWSGFDELTALHPRECIEALMDKDLLVRESTENDARDRQLRDLHWRPASAVMHYASRWHEVDTNEVSGHLQERAGAGSVSGLGPAPPAVREWVDSSRRIPLARAEHTQLDTLLDRRVTCRNFDRAKILTREQFSSVMYRAFAARVSFDYAPGLHILKKGVPSAGGLHPTEAYVVVQHVVDVQPGLYHYHPVDHALEPIRVISGDETAAMVKQFVAGQAHFVDAHAIVIPASRFGRNSWKYRNHAKAYRALILDIGHLSQTIYLAATELGLGAFITAAINEVDIEQAFGLDPLEEGPLAVCGFGVRAAACEETEFDPLNAVWPAA